MIEDVEWGYNRDEENLAQINICMLLGEKSRLPIFQANYSGSLKDVSTLKTTLSKMEMISDGAPILLVMDKGFYSTSNINMMLEESSRFRFITAVPFTSSFALKLIQSESKDIESLQNTIVIGDDTLRGITKRRTWSKKHKLYAHVFYNPRKAIKTREELYAHVTLLKTDAEISPEECLKKDEYRKYLTIRSSEKSPSGYTVSIKNDVINAELKTSGWMVLLSNELKNAGDAIAIYRGKDVVEKGFMTLKNNLDFGRIRSHRTDTMNNKLFAGFIALILSCHIHKVMSDNNLYQKMTMKKLILTLAKLRVQKVNGHRILFPLTKEQKSIFKAFGLKLPV
jgi:transposase